MKWKTASGKYRKSIAEALTTVTPVLFATQRNKPDDKLIRSALLGWAFNTNRGNDKDCPPDIVHALRWIDRSTKPIAALAQPQVIRATLDALASKLDGTGAAATTVNRKRAVPTNALSYTVEIGVLSSNPITSINWRAPKASHVVDRRSVVNPVQARTLLAVVKRQQRSGPRLVAFLAVMYFAALRPEEAVNLRRHNLALPKTGWGELHLEGARPHAGREWTDRSKIRDKRQLKHRAKGEIRTVPSPPELTVLLQSHLEQFGTDAKGRLFRGERGERCRRSPTRGCGPRPAGMPLLPRFSRLRWPDARMTFATRQYRRG